MIYDENLHLKAEDFQHEKDRSFLFDILNSSFVEQITAFISDNHLEEVYSYVYRSSCIELTEDNAEKIIQMLKNACNIFGLKETPKVYLAREYEGTIEVKGFTQPIIFINSRYLEIADEKSLFGEISAAVAGIITEHHKASFIADVIEIAVEQLPFALSKGYEAIVNSWKRARFLTYDRVFLMVTKDYHLTVRHLLLGKIPNDMLEECDSLIERMMSNQSEVFDKLLKDRPVFTIAQKISVEEAWIPERFKELEKLRGTNYGK